MRPALAEGDVRGHGAGGHGHGSVVSLWAREKPGWVHLVSGLWGATPHPKPPFPGYFQQHLLQEHSQGRTRSPLALLQVHLPGEELKTPKPPSLLSTLHSRNLGTGGQPRPPFPTPPHPGCLHPLPLPVPSPSPSPTTGGGGGRRPHKGHQDPQHPPRDRRATGGVP